MLKHVYKTNSGDFLFGQILKNVCKNGARFVDKNSAEAIDLLNLINKIEQLAFDAGREFQYKYKARPNE